MIIFTYKMNSLPLSVRLGLINYLTTFNTVFNESDSRGRFMCVKHVYNSSGDPRISRTFLKPGWVASRIKHVLKVNYVGR